MKDADEPARLAAENAMLRSVLEAMPHGLGMFDADDRLLLVNRHYVRLWSLPDALTQVGTPAETIETATLALEVETN